MNKKLAGDVPQNSGNTFMGFNAFCGNQYSIGIYLPIAKTYYVEKKHSKYYK